MRTALVLLLSLALCPLVACDDDSSSPVHRADLGLPGADARPDAAPVADLGMGAVDALTDPNADGGVIPCDGDEACGLRAWCAEGLCTPGRDTSVVALPADGVTRVGAAGFELTPTAWESWTDRAGADCPDNRAGRFDGRLDTPTPADPCADGFDDANGDGHFNAVWLGGDGMDRPAAAVDNEHPPAGRVLVLARDDTVRVVIALDLHALDAARVAELDRRLRLRLGLAEGELLIHTTGNRSGPDATGLHGPSLAVVEGEAGEALQRRLGGRIGLLSAIPRRSGLDEAWFSAWITRAAAAVEQAVARATPAEIAVSRVALPVDPDPPGDGALVVPDADEDGRLNDPADLAAWRARPQRLARDTALPGARDPWLGVVGFRATTDGRPLAWVLSWGAAPAVIPASEPRLSADFPGRVRARLEGDGDARALWITGAAADTVLAGRDAWVPAVDEQGQLVGEDGAPVDDPALARASQSPLAALGTLIAARAQRALADAEWQPASLSAQARYVWLPLTNPRHGLAARLGIMGPLGDWLTGRKTTRRWASAATTPACGGLGCARYRLARIDLGPVSWITTPGALDGGLVRGRSAVEIEYGEALSLADVDLDGVPDAEDDALRVQARGASRVGTVTLPAPLNPQRFGAVTSLATPSIWVLGRFDGGLGSLRDGASVPNVFEGQLDPLADFVTAPQNAAIVLCQSGYPCQSDLTLGELTALTFDAQPEALADLPGGSELRLQSVGLAQVEAAGGWYIEDDEGRLRASGQAIVLGPADRAFTPGVDLIEAGVRRGDLLTVQAWRTPAAPIDGLVPLVLRDHPNAADAWHASSAQGGELVYNTACELIFAGACPHRREPIGADPNETLPRAP